jgi:hypothetical protein
MGLLKDKLIEATQDLKEKYLNQIEKWAKGQYEYLKRVNKYRELDWCRHFGLEPELANASYRLSQMSEAKGMKYKDAIKLIKYDPNLKLERSEFWSLPSGHYNSGAARRQSALQDEARRAMKITIENYILNARNAGIRHYNDSIDKLVDRLIKKGISESREDVKIDKGWVGVNLEMVISVDQIKVKAWTIVAQGEIQRPHYRYLVK